MNFFLLHELFHIPIFLYIYKVINRCLSHPSAWPHWPSGVWLLSSPQPLSQFDIQFLNAVGDLLDLIPALVPSSANHIRDFKLPGMGHCSALIKVRDANTNVCVCVCVKTYTVYTYMYTYIFFYFVLNRFLHFTDFSLNYGRSFTFKMTWNFWLDLMRLVHEISKSVKTKMSPLIPKQHLGGFLV